MTHNAEGFISDWFNEHPEDTSPLDIEMEVDYESRISAVLITRFRLRDAEHCSGRRWEERCLRELCELADLRIVRIRLETPIQAVCNLSWYEQMWRRLWHKPLPGMKRDSFEELLGHLGFTNYDRINLGWTRYPKFVSRDRDQVIVALGSETPFGQRRILSRRMADAARLHP